MRHYFFYASLQPGGLSLSVFVLPCRMTAGAATSLLVTRSGSAHRLRSLRAALAYALSTITPAAHAYPQATTPTVKEPKALQHAPPPQDSTGQRRRRQA